MNRSSYTEDPEYNWQYICWRGAVNSAIKGKRGQAFLKELLEALDALPEKKLIAEELVTPTGEVCAMGAVMVKRGIDASQFDTYNSEKIAQTMGIADALVREIEFINDEACWQEITPEKRFEIVRGWAANHLKEKEGES